MPNGSKPSKRERRTISGLTSFFERNENRVDHLAEGGHGRGRHENAAPARVTAPDPHPQRT
jgi:hypothetical protein